MGVRRFVLRWFDGDARSLARRRIRLTAAVGALLGMQAALAGPASAWSAVWGAPTEISGAPGGGVAYAVSCTMADDCTAVGNDNNNQPMYVTKGAGSWGSPTEISGSPGGGGFLFAVSCTAVDDCTAVGTDNNGQPIYVTESAGSWGSPTEISGSPGGGGFLNAVSCTAADDCTAVGSDNNSQPIYVTENASSWGSPTEISGSPGSDGFLNAVSCAAADDCTAVGSDNNSQPIYVTENAGSWGSPTEISGTPGIGGFLNAVSCTAADDCTAVGYDNNSQPIYVTESAGSWGSPTEISGTPGGSGFLYAMSCTSTGHCTAVGTDNNSQPMYVESTSEYAVTFDAQGGVPTPAVQQVLAGGYASAPTSPSRSGHVFTGWYTQPSGGTEWNFAADPVTSDLTLYARWVVPQAPPAPVQVSVASSADPATSGQPVTFTATLSRNPGCGSVSWLIDNSPPPAGTPTAGSGATWTLGPISTLSAGVHPVTAVFSGCGSAWAEGSGTANQQISPTTTPTPTPSSGVTNPTISAHESSAHPPRHGWYRNRVHITFTCTPGSSSMSGPCPDPVTLSRDGADRTVTRSINDTDGGHASVTVHVKVDRTPPAITKVHPRAGTCTATDALSGHTTCTVHTHRHRTHRITHVHWTAAATDRAGNTIHRHGHYKTH